MSDIRKTVDVIVVGSGGTGLIAALSAAVHGADVLLIESEEGIGGTTLFSGGQIWIPNNHYMEEAGVSDSREEVLAYMHETMPERNDFKRWEAFVEYAPGMLCFMERNTPLRFALSECPDTFSEKKGGKVFGRTVEVIPVSCRQWSKGEISILKIPAEYKVSVPFMFSEVIGYIQKGRSALMSVIPSVIYRVLTGKATMSEGLIAGLLKGCLTNRVEVMLNSRITELIQKNGEVVGVEAKHNNRVIAFSARKGVILATGSFDWNKALKDEFLPGPLEHSITPPSNRGDAVVVAKQVGAKLSRMDEAWYWPAFYTGGFYKGAPLGKLLRRRSYPHTIIVNRMGKRFVNEAEHNMGNALMYERDKATGSLINQPAWLISDSQYRRKYENFSVKLRKPGWLIRDETLKGLADRIKVNAEGLQETVSRFNLFAKQGKDPEFCRNEFLYDRLHGDQRSQYPCLGTIEKPPFYALQVFCSSVGTKGGLMTNAHWQVIREDESVIEGLYAVGNCSAAIIGPITIAPAATLGSGMTAGYIAGKHAAESK